MCGALRKPDWSRKIKKIELAFVKASLFIYHTLLYTFLFFTNGFTCWFFNEFSKVPQIVRNIRKILHQVILHESFFATSVWLPMSAIQLIEDTHFSSNPWLHQRKMKLRQRARNKNIFFFDNYNLKSNELLPLLTTPKSEKKTLITDGFVIARVKPTQTFKSDLRA